MSVQWGDAAVEGTGNQWRAIGQWFTLLEADRPVPSPEITSYVQTLIAGAPDFYTRLSRITDAIQNNIRYFVVMRGIGGHQANHAADIFRNRYGDCKDKTTLLISMLQRSRHQCLLRAGGRSPGIRRSRRAFDFWRSHDHRDRDTARRERLSPYGDGERPLMASST